MKTTRLGAVNSDSVKNHVLCQRKSWLAFSTSLTNHQFRQYFRMSWGCFQHPCNNIEASVGEEVFKNEAYFDQLRHFPDKEDKNAVRMIAHKESTGGFVLGEVKLALTLCLFTGGLYLDLCLLYKGEMAYAHKIFHADIQDWILDDRFVKINRV